MCAVKTRVKEVGVGLFLRGPVVQSGGHLVILVVGQLTFSFPAAGFFSG